MHNNNDAITPTTHRNFIELLLHFFHFVFEFQFLLFGRLGLFVKLADRYLGDLLGTIAPVVFRIGVHRADPVVGGVFADLVRLERQRSPL